MRAPVARTALALQIERRQIVRAGDRQRRLKERASIRRQLCEPRNLPSIERTGLLEQPFAASVACAPEQRGNVLHTRRLGQLHRVAPSVVERAAVNERDARFEDWLAPMQSVGGCFRRIAARGFPIPQAIDVLAVVAAFARLARDRFGSQLPAARVGVERRARDTERGGGLLGGEEVRCSHESRDMLIDESRLTSITLPGKNPSHEQWTGQCRRRVDAAQSSRWRRRAADHRRVCRRRSGSRGDASRTSPISCCTVVSPSWRSATRFARDLASRRALPRAALELLQEAAAVRTPPMDALRMAAPVLSLGRREDPLEDAMTAIAAFPTIVGTLLALLQGEQPVASRDDLGHAAHYLHQLLGTEPSADRARALETYLNTVCDHGLNASTFAARVIVSTRSDVISAITGAVGALKGPLHGGAPGPALDMVFEIGTPERAEPVIRAMLDRGERLMGFGHRVYRVRDPRADVLAQAAERFYASDVRSVGVRAGASRRGDRASVAA